MPDHSDAPHLVELDKPVARRSARDGARPFDIFDELPRLGLDEALRVLWRRKALLIGSIIVVMSIALLSIFQMTSRYTATTTVMIDPRQQQVVDIQAVVSGLAPDAFTIESEMEVISSRAVVRRVIDKLNLDERPEFNPALEGGSTGLVGKIKNGIKAVIPESWIDAIRGRTELENDPAQAERVMARIMQRVYANLTVAPVGRSRVIAVSFTSEDPQLAADAANAVAEEYIVQQLESEFNATQQATQWLNDRLAQLRAQTEASEKAVADFRNREVVIEGRGPELITAQIAQLSEQFVAAQARQNEAQSRLANVERLTASGGNQAIFNTFESPYMDALREQAATLRQREAELSAEYGPRHPVMVNLNAELQSIQQQMSTEAQNYIASVRGELQIAQEQVASLRQSLDDLQQEAAKVNEADVQLAALDREAAANRTLFETFLSRFKETEQIGLAQPDAYIVSPAGIPTSASYPKQSMLMGIAFAIALALGLALIIAAELLEAGLRSGEEVEKALGLPSLGLVPTLSSGVLGRRKPHDYVLEKPFSAYSESLRALYTSLLVVQQREHLGNAILVTSAVPSEGKSALVSSLARVVASGGRRVLVIDCDMRRPQMHTIFGVSNDIGLTNYLQGRVNLDQILFTGDPSGAHVISAGPTPTNPQEILRSPRMGQLISQLRGNYDVVLIDAPPVMAVSDPRVLAGIADQCVFVAKWRETRRATVKHAVRQMRETDIYLTGVVLTQVDVRRHAMYGFGDSGYYYGKYGKYYLN